MERLNPGQTKDIIASEIKKLIFSGELKDGSEITQNEIAESLSLSRMPVREAFQSLANEGFLTRLANRHVRINGISYEKCEAVFKVLIAIEREAFDYVDLSKLGMTDNEKDWHLKYIAETNNSVLYSIVETIISGYPGYFFLEKRDEKRIEILNNIIEKKDTSLFSLYLDNVLCNLKEAFNA